MSTTILNSISKYCKPIKELGIDLQKLTSVTDSCGFVIGNKYRFFIPEETVLLIVCSNYEKALSLYNKIEDTTQYDTFLIEGDHIIMVRPYTRDIILDLTNETCINGRRLFACKVKDLSKDFEFNDKIKVKG